MNILSDSVKFWYVWLYTTQGDQVFKGAKLMHNCFSFFFFFSYQWSIELSLAICLILRHVRSRNLTVPFNATKLNDYKFNYKFCPISWLIWTQVAVLTTENYLVIKLEDVSLRTETQHTAPNVTCKKRKLVQVISI